MARLWSTGFELQSVESTAAIEWDSTTGFPTIDTTTKRSGAASMRCNTAAATAFLIKSIAASASAGWILYGRFCINVTSFPSSGSVTIYRNRDNFFGTNDLEIRLTSGGVLQLWQGSSGPQIGSDSSALSTGTWYRIEVLQDNAATYTAKLDGSQFATGTPTASGDHPDQIRIGNITSTTADIYFDDIAINDTSGSTQNSYPGDGKITHLRPAAAGDNNNASSGDYTSVDEVTPDDATTIAVLSNDNDILDVKVDSSSTGGIGSSDTITLVQVGIREAAVTGALETWALRIKSASGGTTTQGTSTDHNDVTYRTNGDATPRNYTLTSYTDPTTTVAWTPTGTNSLDNMQIGVKAIDATPDINVSTLWALVEYVSAPATTTSTTSSSSSSTSSTSSSTSSTSSSTSSTSTSSTSSSTSSTSSSSSSSTSSTSSSSSTSSTSSSTSSTSSSTSSTSSSTSSTSSSSSTSSTSSSSSTSSTSSSSSTSSTSSSTSSTSSSTSSTSSSSSSTSTTQTGTTTSSSSSSSSTSSTSSSTSSTSSSSSTSSTSSSSSSSHSTSSSSSSTSSTSSSSSTSSTSSSSSSSTSSTSSSTSTTHSTSSTSSSTSSTSSSSSTSNSTTFSTSSTSSSTSTTSTSTSTSTTTTLPFHRHYNRPLKPIDVVLDEIKIDFRI